MQLLRGNPLRGITMFYSGVLSSLAYLYTIRDDNSISSYPDDNTPYILGDTPAVVVNLDTCSVKQFDEFSNNQI